MGKFDFLHGREWSIPTVLESFNDGCLSHGKLAQQRWNMMYRWGLVNVERKKRQRGVVTKTNQQALVCNPISLPEREMVPYP